MINIWTVCVGNKYTDEDVYIVRNMVAKHLEEPHDFYCLSDRQIGDINCFIPDEKWPGWWSKLLLFRYAGGQVLYLDLDVVIVGDLGRLISKELSMPANWAQSGHGGCQSSVMSWDSIETRLEFIPDTFNPKKLSKPNPPNYGLYGEHKLWGDQEYITDCIGDPGHEIKAMEHVFSYKYHCRNGLPEDASVICFHGNPKPNQVSDAWVLAERSSIAI